MGADIGISEITCINRTDGFMGLVFFISQYPKA